MDSAWTDEPRDLAVRYARAVESGNGDAGALRVALACSVLSSPLVAAASAALVEGPHAISRGLELAQIILDLLARAALSSERSSG